MLLFLAVATTARSWSSSLWQTAQDARCASSLAEAGSPSARRARASGSQCGTVHLQPGAQPLERAADVALHRAERQVEHTRDLRMGQVLVEGQLEDPLLRLPEPGELVRDQYPVGHAVCRRLDELWPDERSGCGSQSRVPGASGPPVGDDVPADAEQPAWEAAVRGAVVLAPLPGSDEHDLGDVLRVRRHAEGPQRQRVDER